mmetsp:Transcript_75026/g.179075  ORF Transcript_75026/g.179075 Transcript_75026/m.179075 type:complete len:301 (+) Transcript_75026:362-1264(+)
MTFFRPLENSTSRRPSPKIRSTRPSNLRVSLTSSVADTLGVALAARGLAVSVPRNAVDGGGAPLVPLAPPIGALAALATLSMRPAALELPELTVFVTAGPTLPLRFRLADSPRFAAATSFSQLDCWACAACWFRRFTSSWSSEFFLVNSVTWRCRRSTVRCHLFSFSFISSSSWSAFSCSLCRSSCASFSSFNCCLCLSAASARRRLSFRNAARSTSNSAWRAVRSASTSFHSFSRSRAMSRSAFRADAWSFFKVSFSFSYFFSSSSKAVSRAFASAAASSSGRSRRSARSRSAREVSGP